MGGRALSREGGHGRAGRIVGRVRGERDWSTEEARRLVEALLDAR